MKEKIIKTDKATLLVVELPEGGKRIAGIACDITGHFILWDDGGSYHDDNRPHGQFRIDDNPRNKWKLLGRIPDITEDDAKEIVDSYEYPMSRDILGFEDYQSKWFDMKDTALDSLHSLLQANEVYFENPLGVRYAKGWDAETDYRSFLNWQESQSKVWDKERTYLFIKVD